jgi:hypothetical protein
MRANIAVSLRKDSDAAASNAVTSVNLSLHTDREDAVERLQAIHAETDAAKKVARSGQSSAYELFNSMPPFVLALLGRTLTPAAVLNMMKCNFLVSSVKGSERQMYIAGARVEAMYPISLLAPGMGLNFTCVSYVDNIDFGITCDADLIADPWRIVAGLREALDEYLALCAVARKLPTAGRKRGARATAPATTAKRVAATKRAAAARRKPARRSPRA